MAQQAEQYQAQIITLAPIRTKPAEDRHWTPEDVMSILFPRAEKAPDRPVHSAEIISFAQYAAKRGRRSGLRAKRCSDRKQARA